MDNLKVQQNDNLKKLKELVDSLDNELHHKEYNLILKDIEKIIKEEKKIINKLQKSDAKLRHYEIICSSILSLIAAK